MVELCGARLVPGTIDAYPEPVEPRVVGLRPARVERLLGESIPPGTIERILTHARVRRGTPEGEAASR